MTVEYREFLDAVSRTAGLDTHEARVMAGATLAALAGVLDPPVRSQLRDALPGEFRDDIAAMTGPRREWDEGTFIRAVAMISSRAPEDVRRHVQAVLSELARHDARIVAVLPLPDHLRALFTPPEPGGGISGPMGHDAPLTDDEITDALRGLPDWSGDSSGLRRTLALPPSNLDRVLLRLGELRTELGRAPVVHRGGENARPDGIETVELEVKTAAVGAVTARDVELAGRVDEIVDEAGAGMASP